MSKKQQIAVGIGIFISAVFLWFAFRDLHPGDIFDQLGQVNIALLLAGVVCHFISVVVITLRWQYLLRSIQFVPLHALFSLVCIGYMGNNVYPFRSGEALRIVLLRRNYRVPIVRATTTVFVERIFDGIVMLTFIVVPLLLTDISSDEVRQVATLATPIFLAALVIFFGLALHPDLLRRLVRRFGVYLPGKLQPVAQRICEDVISGLEGLRTPKDLAGAVTSSYATWAIGAGVFWIVAAAFSMNVSYPVTLIIVGAVNLAGLLPASPGQIGVFEFFVSAVLVSTGITEAQAAAYALVVHIVIWLPMTLAGFLFLIRQGLGLDAIKNAHEMEEKAVISG